MAIKITFDEAQPVPADMVGLDVRLTEAAARRVQEILAKPAHQGHSLRVAVVGGGCSGFSYKFSITKEKTERDHVLTHPATPGVEVWIDFDSFLLLKGSVLDFEDTLEASQFVIKNPNAKSSCGCGNSFAV